MIVVNKISFNGETLKASIHVKDIHSFEEKPNTAREGFRDRFAAANTVLFVKSPIRISGGEREHKTIGYANGIATFHIVESFDKIQKLIKDSK